MRPPHVVAPGTRIWNNTNRQPYIQTQTLSAFEGRGGKADFLAGLELEDEEADLTTKGHGHGHGHKAGKKQHQHASLGFNSIGLVVKDGPLDWALFEDWLNNQVMVAPPEEAGGACAVRGSKGNQIVRCKGTRCGRVDGWMFE